MPDVVRNFERGSVALYAAVVIPFVVSLCIIAVDFSRLHASRESAQKEADRIALQSAQFLPDTVAASEYALRAVSELSGLSVSSSDSQETGLQVSTSSVALSLDGQTEAVLDVFLEMFGLEGKVFRFRERSVVQVIPSDYVVILSDARSVRPAEFRPWGDALVWPQSKYFNFVAPPELVFSSAENSSGESSEDGPWNQWWKHWNEIGFRRWLTQTCYNPLYSSLKYAGISLVDVFGAGATNRVSVIFSPGEDSRRGFTVLRDIDFPRPESAIAEARWLGYSEPRSYPVVSDEACLYFADYSASAEDTYLLSSAPQSFGLGGKSVGGCDEQLQTSPWEGMYRPEGKLSQCFVEQGLRLREAIYYHAARANEHLPHGENITRAINEAFLQLVNVSSETLAELQQKRGNLVARAPRKIVVVSDVLPDTSSASFTEIFARLSEQGIKLVLVGFVPNELSSVQEIRLLSQELDQAVAAAEEIQSDFLEVLRASSATELHEIVIPKIIGTERGLVIRS